MNVDQSSGPDLGHCSGEYLRNFVTGTAAVLSQTAEQILAELFYTDVNFEEGTGFVYRVNNIPGKQDSLYYTRRLLDLGVFGCVDFCLDGPVDSRTMSSGATATCGRALASEGRNC